MRIGVIGAMPEEIALLKAEMQVEKEHSYAGRTYYEGKLFHIDCVLVLSRIGKVASASTTTTLINQFNIDLVIFTGVAGSGDKTVKIGDVVIADNLVQHDIDASPIFPKYEIPLLGMSYFEVHEKHKSLLNKAVDTFLKTELKNNRALSNFGITDPKAHWGTIASGDQFIKDHLVLSEIKKNVPTLKCVEMEGAAVAQVCYEHEVPFLIIRTISDNADHSAPVDFNVFISEVASHYSRDILKCLCEELKNL
jgi:adenosylhomocysteine nucleosidase